MSDVDRTKTEIENHESKAEPHHTRYTDTEARTATDGQIDADTVDGQHASQLGGNLTVDSVDNLRGTRSVNTWYQNTSGGPKYLAVAANPSEVAYLRISSTQSGGVVARIRSGEGTVGVSGMVPDGWYYQYDGSTGQELRQWAEFDLSA